MFHRHAPDSRASITAAAAGLLDAATYSPQIRDAVDVLISSLDNIDDSAGARLKSAPARALVERLAAERRAFAKALRFGEASLDPNELALVSAPAPSNRHRVGNVALGTGSAGGFLVPTITMNELLIRQKYYSAVRSVARVIPTTGGGPLIWPTTDDVANLATLLSEATISPTSDFTFGSVTLNAYKTTSGIIPVSLEILQDSAIDIEDMVINLFADRFGRGLNTLYTTGTGTAQPQGALTGASLGVTLPTGNTTTLTFAGLVALFNSVDVTYRMRPSCVFMMNDNTLQFLRGMVDTAGRPLWVPEALPPEPGMTSAGVLLGKRIIMNPDLPVMAASAKPVLFGDFSTYGVREVQQVLVLRLTDSAYTSKGQVGFLAFARSDGRILAPAGSNTIRFMQNSAT